MDLDDFDHDEVSPWVRRGASRPSALGRVLLSNRNDSMDKLMNYRYVYQGQRSSDNIRLRTLEFRIGFGEKV